MLQAREALCEPLLNFLKNFDVLLECWLPGFFKGKFTTAQFLPSPLFPHLLSPPLPSRPLSPPVPSPLPFPFSGGPGVILPAKFWN